MSIARQQGVRFTLWKLLCLAGFLLLAAEDVAATSFRAPHDCISNLGMLDIVIQQWALDNRLSQTNTYSFADPKVLSCLPSNKLPGCPRGGTYLEGINVSDPPKCSLHGTVESAKEMEHALAVVAAWKRLIWPLVFVSAGLLLCSPRSRLPVELRNWLPMPCTLAYLIAFAPNYLTLFVYGGRYDAMKIIYVLGTLMGGLVLSWTGLKSEKKSVRLFAIVANAYCVLILVLAFMHATFMHATW